MSTIFEDVLTNAKAAEAKYIGPDYPYYKYIRTPSEMGMSGAGNLTQLGKDIDGLINYVELLVSGGGKASSTGQPLGNKFFLKTRRRPIYLHKQRPCWKYSIYIIWSRCKF